ncbi:MAG: amino acid racemase [Phascolarctobacterium sp.]|uniref:aspartate/glutamate racemase family protein n=1 Tax=Phascolarctobacterium sp. TaxID=2049039 RepID=UPI0026DD0831|nr:amino acid racemase [Phascolarctobacterium sp.]MDO4922310.1 amino acid racemase [Phascolarctobacterium sp.]
MKKLGLIGGVGPEATVPYYLGIVYGVQKKLNKPFFPPLVIESLSCFEVIRMSSQNDKEGLTNYLLAGIRNLAAAGADVGALACNTGHMVFQELQRLSPIPLVSIVETTRAETQRQNFKKVGLLGTSATMESDYFTKSFTDSGIKIVIPKAKDRDYIADRILNELELGIVKEETGDQFIHIAEEMAQEEKIEALILGCTELPLLFQNKTLSVPVLDTMQLHIQALVNKILEE